MSGIQKLKILMVSGEYPPMTGGVARYTLNLVQALEKRPEVEQMLVASNLATTAKPSTVDCVKRDVVQYGN